MKEKTPLKVAMHVSIGNICANIVLSIFKLTAGIVANSFALISDAIDSAADVFSTFIAMIGIKISAREADEKHEYGHERFECVAGIVLAVILLGIGLLIGAKAVQILVTGSYNDMQAPGVFAIVAAVVSIIFKEGMFWNTRHYAIKLNSTALKADAWNYRGDALSSIGALIGIIGAMMGVMILDSIASLVICLFIIKAAISIFMDAISKMTDEACDDETEEAIKNKVLESEGVGRIDLLQTRKFGNKVYVELEIAVDDNLPLVKAHAIAEEIHHNIENTFDFVKHITIHVNPLSEEDNNDKDRYKINIIEKE